MGIPDGGGVGFVVGSPAGSGVEIFVGVPDGGGVGFIVESPVG